MSYSCVGRFFILYSHENLLWWLYLTASFLPWDGRFYIVISIDDFIFELLLLTLTFSSDLIFLFRSFWVSISSFPGPYFLSDFMLKFNGFDFGIFFKLDLLTFCLDLVRMMFMELSYWNSVVSRLFFLEVYLSTSYWSVVSLFVNSSMYFCCSISFSLSSSDYQSIWI